MRRLEDFLHASARRCPDKVAIVCGDEAVSYARLEQMVAERAASLCVKGRGVVFRAVPTLGFLVDYMAIHEAGGVAVPLEKDVPAGVFDRVCRQVATAQFADGMADVLFTTGTTGRQKGVMVSHRALVADAENLAEAQRYSADVTFVAAGPLNHIGTLSKLYPTLLVGGTFAVVDGLRDPNAFFAAIARAECGRVATFLVPATIRMLLALCPGRLAACASKVDFVETGAAPMAQADMERLRQLMPHTRLYNTYASTETGIIATHDYAAGPCEAGCLGRPMRHSAIRVAPDGHIVCTGLTLMDGYLADDAQTKAILHGGELHTADLGVIDSEGRLRLTGRVGDTINVGGYKVAPSEVEDIALSFEGVADCICIAAPHPVMGCALKLLVVMEPGHKLNKRSLALHIRQKAEAYKVPMLYQEVEAVNRTYNGKLDRKSYTHQDIKNI